MKVGSALVNTYGWSTILRLVVGLSAILIQNAGAGSAVAWDGLGHLVYSYGRPVKEAEQRALAICRHRYGGNVRLIASSDVVGDGAIAIARRGNSSVVGVALGHRSPLEAEILALRQCLKAGGTDPKVRWGFKG
jgi:hypothetical protein